MKTLLLTLPVAFILGISCSSFSEKVSVNELKQDTVVRFIRKIYNDSWEGREFFVVIKKDTSAYSCIFSYRKNRNLNMAIHLSSESKYYSDVAINDTAAVGTDVVEFIDKYYVPTYSQWLREMELCFKSASKVYDLGRLSSIAAFLPYLSDAAVLATNNLVANFKPERDGLYSYSDIAKSIEMTPFKDDLNKILDEYGLEVKEVYCEGPWISIDPDGFIKKNNISKTLKISYDIIGIPVRFYLKKQDEGHANKTAPSEQRR